MMNLSVHEGGSSKNFPKHYSAWPIVVRSNLGSESVILGSFAFVSFKVFKPHIRRHLQIHEENVTCFTANIAPKLVICGLYDTSGFIFEVT